MPRQQIAMIAIPLGLVLFVASYLWPESGITGGGWTEERSQAHAKESAKLHQMAYAGQHEPPGAKKKAPPGHNHDHGGDAPVSKSDLDLQWEKVRAGQAQLDAARSGGIFWAQMMWCMGILLGGGGVAAAYLLPPHESEKQK